MRLRRPVLAIAAASALLLAIAAPATAQLKPPPPLPDNPAATFYYNLWFGPTPDGWSPQGTVVADSGFRSFPNGFPYPNYGGMMDVTNAFFGTPSGPMVGLNSVDMRSLYGDGVCTTTRGLTPGGPCTLTPAAEYWAEYLFGTAQHGVCFGMAATSAAVYNGSSSPQTVGAGTLTFQSRLTPATQRTVLRNYSAQYTLFGVPTQSITPVEVVETLRSSLVEGTAPYVLTLSGQVDGEYEGHAITPYAIYDRGNGLVDIAVYDNNYPTRDRAVHVDTVANTWEYLMQTNPSGTQALISGDATSKSLGLVAVDDVLDVQPCIVCDGVRPVDLVTIAPTPIAAGSVDFDMVDLAGQPLPESAYVVLPPLNPPSQSVTTLPAVELSPGAGFGVKVDGTETTQPIPLTVGNYSGQGAKVASVASMPAGFVATAMYGDNRFSFTSSVPATIGLTRGFTVGQRHFSIEAMGGRATEAGNGREIRLDRQKGRAHLRDADGKGGAMAVAAELRVGNSAVVYTSRVTAYPAGGELVVVYGSWRQPGQAPQLWLDRDGDGTLDKRIPMRKVG